MAVRFLVPKQPGRSCALVMSSLRANPSSFFTLLRAAITARAHGIEATHSLTAETRAEADVRKD